MSDDKIKNVNCPIMVIHSAQDEMIPFFHSKLMIENLPHNINSKYLTIKGNHNNPKLNNDYCNEVENFLQECKMSECAVDK